jgi:hypothetical protein
LALELSLVLAIAALVGLYAVEEFLGSRLRPGDWNVGRTRISKVLSEP